jgi:hypothetical protein
MSKGRKRNARQEVELSRVGRGRLQADFQLLSFDSHGYRTQGLPSRKAMAAGLRFTCHAIVQHTIYLLVRPSPPMLIQLYKSIEVR